MGASEQEIKEFLKKRGYDAEVEQVNPKTIQISLHSKTVSEVAKIFANVTDGSRFIVSMHYPDIIELVEEGTRLNERLEQVRQDLLAETRRLNTELNDLAISLSNRIKREERLPWWKKPWRRGG